MIFKKNPHENSWAFWDTFLLINTFLCAVLSNVHIYARDFPQHNTFLYVIFTNIFNCTHTSPSICIFVNILAGKQHSKIQGSANFKGRLCFGFHIVSESANFDSFKCGCSFSPVSREAIKWNVSWGCVEHSLRMTQGQKCGVLAPKIHMLMFESAVEPCDVICLRRLFQLVQLLTPCES